MRASSTAVALALTFGVGACAAPQQHVRPADIRPFRTALSADSSDAPADSARWYAGPIGLHIGKPAGPSLGLGVLRSFSCTPAETCADRETIGMLIAEPGLNAGRASVGVTRVLGGLGTAWTARASYLQRWRTSTERYGGLELSFHPIVYVGARVGAFRPLGREERSILWTLDASFGL